MSCRRHVTKRYKGGRRGGGQKLSEKALRNCWTAPWEYWGCAAGQDPCLFRASRIGTGAFSIFQFWAPNSTFCDFLGYYHESSEFHHYFQISQQKPQNFINKYYTCYRALKRPLKHEVYLFIMFIGSNYTMLISKLGQGVFCQGQILPLRISKATIPIPPPPPPPRM